MKNDLFDCVWSLRKSAALSLKRLIEGAAVAGVPSANRRLTIFSKNAMAAPYTTTNRSLRRRLLLFPDRNNQEETAAIDRVRTRKRTNIAQGIGNGSRECIFCDSLRKMPSERRKGSSKYHPCKIQRWKLSVNNCIRPPPRPYLNGYGRKTINDNRHCRLGSRPVNGAREYLLRFRSALSRQRRNRTRTLRGSDESGSRFKCFIHR